jgi:hypothetical protein
VVRGAVIAKKSARADVVGEIEGGARVGRVALATSTWLISTLRMWRRKKPKEGIWPNMLGSG